MVGESADPSIVEMEIDASDATVQPQVADDGSAVDSMAPSDASEAGGLGSTCRGKNYAVCLDFEGGSLDAPWGRGARNCAKNPACPLETTSLESAGAKVEEGRAAHGRYAMHFSNLHAKPSMFLGTSELGTITNLVWGRFYLYMDPGAPSGHGALVRTWDQATDCYEVGFERNAYLGDWHLPPAAPGGERYMRSKAMIPGAWACVEFLFDGAQGAMAQVWSDGVAVTFDDIAKTPPIAKAVQFKSFDIGIEFYHGSSLISYQGDEAPFITDMWIDDIALDTKRIGCVP